MLLVVADLSVSYPSTTSPQCGHTRAVFSDGSAVAGVFSIRASIRASLVCSLSSFAASHDPPRLTHRTYATNGQNKPSYIKTVLLSVWQLRRVGKAGAREVAYAQNGVVRETQSPAAGPSYRMYLRVRQTMKTAISAAPIRASAAAHI
jgi:hypothetical protein